MVEKPYKWPEGAELGEHSKSKLSILRGYFFQYLIIRCQHPQQTRFRLAVIDGFAGGGRYKCGTAGSPIAFIEEIKNAVHAINLERKENNLQTIIIECLFIFNDSNTDVIEILKLKTAPLLAEIKENIQCLKVKIEYMNDPFDEAYSNIKQILLREKFKNVIFNLDQCGHIGVDVKIIIDIMRRSYISPEIFYTFAIKALTSFLRKSDLNNFKKQLRMFDLSDSDFHSLSGPMNTKEWLGLAERIVYERFQKCAEFVSPFSINSPGGWRRYWLIHFSNSHVARAAYNGILHKNSTSQAHFWRSGLNMLSYNLKGNDVGLYLFESSDRQKAKNQLLEDIPRLISESGNVIGVDAFYRKIYNITPAHSDEIHSAMLENPDIKVITQIGGERRKANAIRADDLLKLKRQKSFLFRNP